MQQDHFTSQCLRSLSAAFEHLADTWRQKKDKRLQIYPFPGSGSERRDESPENIEMTVLKNSPRGLKT